jgi:DNA-binding CsgD family transcriptional regulator
MAIVCGAGPLADRARSELHVAGARRRRDRITGRDALTPTEQRIAGLAAGGDTNREIAQALFVTPKTVELHLTNVYRKLDITGRAQLAQALENATL